MNTKVAEAVGTTIEELQDVIEYDDTQNQEAKYEVKENNDIKYLVADKRPNVVLRTINLFFKRIIDIIGAIVGIIFLIPITIGVYIANKKVKDDGPIFFVQERIGRDGKIFKMYKYRSMVVGADEKLEKYLAENPAANAEYRIFKKLKDDPRITKVGDFLRKTSLDEFPQFINVLKGDMSLVGPRPYLPREKDDMGYYFNDIVKCKPGITGFWQVNGRNDVTFDDRLGMDITYFQKTNLLLDIKLLIKTGLKVLRKEGAA